MKINFFEEFPSKESFSKLDLLDHKPDVFVAARSKRQFLDIISPVKAKVGKAYYWPVLPMDQGYYLSPFIKTKVLKKVLRECSNTNMLWDAELPRRRSLIFTSWHRFPLNKFLILRFFKKYGHKIYTAEYNIKNRLGEFWLKRMGLSFSPKIYGNTVAKMVYNSLHNLDEESMKKIVTFYLKNNEKFALGLGTIGSGINETEPDIRPKMLKRDLEIADELGVKEVIIFRLGGLNKKYAKIINRF